jgi:hypothetical protein
MTRYSCVYGCTRLAAESDKAYQLLAHGRWFSLGTPASSTTKTGRHDIAENIVESGVKTPCNLYIYTMNDAFNCTLVLTNLTIFHYIEYNRDLLK